jgi:hypothetical protein
MALWIALYHPQPAQAAPSPTGLRDPNVFYGHIKLAPNYHYESTAPETESYSTLWSDMSWTSEGTIYVYYDGTAKSYAQIYLDDFKVDMVSYADDKGGTEWHSIDGFAKAVVSRSKSVTFEPPIVNMLMNLQVNKSAFNHCQMRTKMKIIGQGEGNDKPKPCKVLLGDAVDGATWSMKSIKIFFTVSSDRNTLTGGCSLPEWNNNPDKTGQYTETCSWSARNWNASSLNGTFKK